MIQGVLTTGMIYAEETALLRLQEKGFVSE